MFIHLTSIKIPMLFPRDDVVGNLYNYHQLSQISRDIQLPLVRIYILQDTHQTVSIIFSNFANGLNFDHNFVRQEHKKNIPKCLWSQSEPLSPAVFCLQNYPLPALNCCLLQINCNC